MRRATPVVMALAALGIALCAPLRGEWILDASKTFMAERRAQPHPCCAYVLTALVPVETPATVCAYYVNNLRRGSRGRITLRGAARGLETGVLLREWRAAGRVRDNMWMQCTQLGAASEPCLLELGFSLTGFPRMKNKLRRRDGFAAGLFVVPGTVETEVRSWLELEVGAGRWVPPVRGSGAGPWAAIE